MKTLTLRPAEVPRFLRPSGLVVIPCKVQPEHVGDGIYRILVGRGRWVTNELIERKFVAGKMISEMNVVDPLEEMMKRHCPCPLGGPGTEWVGREKFIPCVGCGLDSKTADASYVCLEDGTQIFRNGNVDKWTLKDPPNWKAEMHVFLPARRMPDWASRIRKTTTRVELRRVRTITVPECTAYGISDPDGKLGWAPNAMVYAFIEIFNARYPGAWDRDDYAWFVFYTDTLGKD